jgi:hypothetical protein
VVFVDGVYTFPALSPLFVIGFQLTNAAGSLSALLHLLSLAPITNRCHPGDNVGMDAGEQLAAEILDAIRSGRDLWMFDQFIEGPDRLERARKVLIEKRDARSDADEAAFLTSIILGLESGDGPPKV